MSAFVCSPDLFKALAVFAASRDTHGLRVDPRYVEGFKKLDRYDQRQLASAYANALFAENIRSVMCRYPDTQKGGDMPGPIDMPEHINVSNRDFTLAKYRVSPVWIIKMCDCLDYQSCETDDWQQTPAFRLVEAIRKAACYALPGYDKAPWDYHVETA